ncbi:MAG TPA: NAD(P)/FAD-dependent oxidoreductase [Hyphomicrobiaceae bacterium]|nr:NAD(P)/FAD-dependent oxidoreductase [Hyphomicrobiaceae bacterium]
MAVDVETIVVGAGVVGLAIGRALAARGQEVLVLERHALIGSETSSRNSEVVHAGIYYPTRLCVAGKEMLYRFSAENGVSVARTGKLLVATSESQHVKLDALHKTADANGVTDLVRLTGAEATAMEPELFCTAALLSPSTGVIDSHGLMVALEGHITTHGGQVVLSTSVERATRGNDGTFRLHTGGAAPGTITCARLVLSPGLGASDLARTLALPSGYAPPPTYYAKGQYYALSGKSPFSRHIYPMPDGAWLGLHVTVDIAGRCKFGPDIEWIPEIDYSFDVAKLDKFLGFIRSYYPGLDPSRLHADYTGIRPKLYREGEPVPDFRIDGPETHGASRLALLYGIESPGLTASLAIGELVADLVG